MWIIWRAGSKAYPRTSLPARGPSGLGLRKGLRTCVTHVLRCCCWWCYCFIGHTLTSIGLATLNGFSVQEEACLSFLSSVNECTLSSLEETSDKSAGGTGAWEPGSVLADGWTSTASCPASFLEIGFWSVSRDAYISLRTNIKFSLWWTGPVSSVNNQEEPYFSLEGWLVSKPRTFYGQALENFLCWTHVVISFLASRWRFLTAHRRAELKFD